uniref:NADH-ubiquinone oxidoreductase chain 5 n=1 Tax=Mileewa sharpa TaxID=2984023 RepID=A0A977TM27_9HEMI|nr:NADH dehydrogenase subunit 5 [Mileewa sharpa]UXX17560.1 NADH dehydrogenase subunit 5 [Mileewa sharpa]
MVKFNFYYIWFLTMFFSSLTIFIVSMFFNLNNFVLILEYKLFNLNSANIYYVIVLDWISLVFMSLVMFISSIVVIYSFEYMGLYSYSSIRFLFLVLLFVFSMLLMILSPNLLSIILGWDGLGLVSFCLVIYYQSTKSYLAGMITCLTNRLGDIGLLICICWILSYGSWHFSFYNFYYNDFLIYVLVFSCFTKSAQIPFSCWLPAAMAAPTPVSSLVHSSTLVTAGVYLLIRFFNQLFFNNYYFFFISMMTMLLASLCANYEFDLKKIIALSTLSQLGLMMSSLFLNFIDLSFFHLMSHAMFKSLLFLCSGILIYYMNDNQDIRFMGVVCKMVPFTSCCFNISSMSLCGVPFLSGFYSKDIIIESYSFNDFNLMVYLMFYISLGLTSCYSIRLFYYSMIMNNKLIMTSMLDSFNLMKLSIFLLTFFSILFGCMMMWLINLDMIYVILPLKIKLMTMIMVSFGFWVGYEVLSFKQYFLNLKFYLFNGNMWFMMSNLIYFYNKFYFFSNKGLFVLEWGEHYGATGLSFYLVKLSNTLQLYSMNSMKIFLMSFLIWFLILV